MMSNEWISYRALFKEKIHLSLHKEVVVEKTTIKQQWEKLPDFIATERGVIGASAGWKMSKVFWWGEGFWWSLTEAEATKYGFKSSQPGVNRKRVKVGELLIWGEGEGKEGAEGKPNNVIRIVRRYLLSSPLPDQCSSGRPISPWRDHAVCVRLNSAVRVCQKWSPVVFSLSGCSCARGSKNASVFLLNTYGSEP